MTETRELFDFANYKQFLLEKVGPRKTRTGVKGAMARALRCQPTYVSQVLHGRAHFSLEQGELLADFFGFSAEEKHFFLLLIQKERAGTPSLEKYFLAQLEELRTRRLNLLSRLGGKNQLSEKNRSIYYSSWHHAAVHMAVTVPGLQTVPELARAFAISRKRVADVTAFLCSAGLLVREGEKFRTTASAIRLGNHSHDIIKHHTHWRQKSIESLDEEAHTDLHYSAVVTLSERDVVRIKKGMLEFIRETVDTVRNSDAEKIQAITMDFFDLRRV